MADEAKVAHLVDSDARTRLYVDLMREATEVYNLRASCPEDTTSSAVAVPIARLRMLFDRVDSAAAGAHVVVWPAFVAAAEARTSEERTYFSDVLRRLWESTGYANVLKGLEALPTIWERQERGEQWTALLPSLNTVVM